MVIVKTCKARRRRRRTQDIPRPNWKKLNEYLSQNPLSPKFWSNPFSSGFGFAKNIWDVSGSLELVYLESRHLKSAAAAELNLGCAPWNIKLWILMVLKRKVKSPSFSWTIWLFSPVASTMILQLVWPVELLLLAKGPDYVHLTLLWNRHWKFEN